MLGKDFISIGDASAEDIMALLELASRLKRERKEQNPSATLPGAILGLVFQKPSLRTRVSFEVGIRELGGHALYLSPQEIRLGEREGVADAARVLSRYVDAIVARTFLHSDVELLARYADIPVINGLSDREHPCQVLGDLLTILERYGTLEGRRITFVGEGNNVAHSLLLAASRLGMHIRIASPERYEPDPGILAAAIEAAAARGTEVIVSPNVERLVEGADIVYTDVWYSMGHEDERHERIPIFSTYQVNGRLLEWAGPQALVMHCLPAHRGEEITDDVIDGPRSLVWDQAENRLHAQKALLVELLGRRRKG